MLIPRYFYSGEFSRFYGYFLSKPYIKKRFAKGEYLWRPGQPHQKIHYIISGALMHYANHESGRRKIISFHGAGAVFPGYHTSNFKIELSLVTIALTDTEVLEFTRSEFRQMFEENTALSGQVVNWYALYVNRLLFESVHQEYNPSFVKICNLLYLLTVNQNGAAQISVTQDELAELLGLSRVQVTRGLAQLRRQNIIATGRGKITVTDLPALAQLCSSETTA